MVEEGEGQQWWRRGRAAVVEEGEGSSGGGGGGAAVVEEGEGSSGGGGGGAAVVEEGEGQQWWRRGRAAVVVGRSSEGVINGAITYYCASSFPPLTSTASSMASMSMVIPLTVSDCRTMVKTLVCGMKTITWGAGSCKVAGSTVDYGKMAWVYGTWAPRGSSGGRGGGHIFSK